MARRDNVTLTEGVIWKQILLFTFPVLLSNVFREVYNITNSMICGNYISTEALSAINACSSIFQVFGNMFFGIATGTGIIIARLFGGKKEEELKKTIETVVIFSVGLGLFFTIVTEIAAPLFMKWGEIPLEIYHESEIYFRVYVIGFVSILFSSVVMFILRSVGNSKAPLYFQITSCFVNIGLGMFFVKVLNLGIGGVALATILSETLVDVLSCLTLFRMKEFQFKIKDMKFDFNVCKEMLTLGIPAAIQNMLLGLSTMLVQTYTNKFPITAIAGVGVGNRVANWSQQFTQAFSTVMMSYTGQNMGAGKNDRVKKGVKTTIILCTVVNTICSLIIFIFADSLVALFDEDPEVVYYGSQMTRFMVFSYIPLSWSHVYNAACRGAGNMRFPLIIAVGTQCLFRYLFVRIGIGIVFDIRIIYLSGALCFTLAGVLAATYYNFGKFTKEMNMR